MAKPAAAGGGGLPDKEVLKKFEDLTKDFKSKTESVIKEINGAFGNNTAGALKNYTEMMKQYLEGYKGLTTNAQQANKQLLESMEKTYGEFKRQFQALYNDTVTKTDGSIATGSKDFQAQCEEILKKFPQLPESIYKDVLRIAQDNKGKLNGELEKQYKDIMAKIDKNYQDSKKQLTLPELKVPAALPPPEVGTALDPAKVNAAIGQAMAMQKK